MNVNLVILSGRVGKNPELSYTKNGKPQFRFSLATNEYKGKDESSGKSNYDTVWHNVVIYGKSAESAGRNIKIGSVVLLDTAKSKPYRYTAKDGTTKYGHQIETFSYKLVSDKEKNEAEPQSVSDITNMVTSNEYTF